MLMIDNYLIVSLINHPLIVVVSINTEKAKFIYL